MKKDIYLSDEQYENLLEKVHTAIAENTVFQVIDSAEIGNKYTTSNVGLCNEEFTEYDTALFPEYFLEHGRKSMKYKKMHHLCPFDTRLENIEKNEPTNLSNGCYYTCSLRTKRTNKEQLFDIVERARTLFQTGNSKKRIEQLNQQYFS